MDFQESQWDFQWWGHHWWDPPSQGLHWWVQRLGFLGSLWGHLWWEFHW